MNRGFIAEDEATALLLACKPLARQLAVKVSYELSTEEINTLRGYYRVYSATTENELRYLSHKTGMRPQEISWLTIALEMHHWAQA